MSSFAEPPIDLGAYIRNVADFPKPGVQFKDITPLLAHPPAFRAAIEQMAAPFRDAGIDAIAAAEARGFLFAAPMAIALGAGLLPIRKPGKLPSATVGASYQLEYGQDRLEIHADALVAGRRILLVDDVLATGGTMRACCEIVRGAGAEVVACAFLIELAFLDGRARLGPEYRVESLLSY